MQSSVSIISITNAYHTSRSNLVTKQVATGQVHFGS